MVGALLLKANNNNNNKNMTFIKPPEISGQSFSPDSNYFSHVHGRRQEAGQNHDELLGQLCKDRVKTKELL